MYAMDLSNIIADSKALSSYRTVMYIEVKLP